MVKALVIHCLAMFPLKHWMYSQEDMGQKANLPSMLATEIRGFGTEENSIKLGLLPDWHISFSHVKAQDWMNLSQVVAE